MPNIEVFHIDADEFDPFDDDTWMGERIRESLRNSGDIGILDELGRYQRMIERTGRIPPEFAEKAAYAGETLTAAQKGLAGWYWWFCFPGCLPDSEARGPYETELAAELAALEEEEGGC